MVVLVTSGCGYIDFPLCRELRRHHAFRWETISILDNLSAVKTTLRVRRMAPGSFRWDSNTATNFRRR